MLDRQGPRGEPDGSLPAVVAVRTRVRKRGRDAVVIEFANGARLRYRETDGPVEEAWLPPGADTADAADPPVVNERETEADAESLALRAVGEYLSFDGRRRAAFVWGERNLAVLLGEREG
jgi:hypothetical protein